METITKFIVSAVMMLLPITELVAQNNQTIKEFKQPPKPTEDVIDVITGTQYVGIEYDWWKRSNENEWMFDCYVDGRRSSYTEEELLVKLMTEARKNMENRILFFI